MCASRVGGDRRLKPSDIPSLHLPYGSAETKDHRENGAPRPNRDTDALRETPAARTNPDIRARARTTPPPYRNPSRPFGETPRLRFGSLLAQGMTKPKPERHRDSKDPVSALAEGTEWLFPE